jgi:hypothetical protein
MSDLAAEYWEGWRRYFVRELARGRDVGWVGRYVLMFDNRGGLRR